MIGFSEEPGPESHFHRFTARGHNFSRDGIHTQSNSMCYCLCGCIFGFCSDCITTGCFACNPKRKGWNCRYGFGVSCVRNLLGSIWPSDLDNSYFISMVKCLSSQGPPSCLFCSVKTQSVKVPGVPRDCMWIYPSSQSCPEAVANKGEFIVNEVRNVILYMHGGAFTFFRPQTELAMLAEYARVTNCPLLAVDYSRPPNAVFPQQGLECESAYDWLISGAIGEISSAQIFLSGDSAGGCLALDLARNLRMKKKPSPAGVIVLSPWVDLLIKENEGTKDNQQYDIIKNTLVGTKAASLYVPPPTLLSPMASFDSARANVVFEDPSSKKDLYDQANPLSWDLTDRALPPLLVIYGGSEVLRDAIREFVNKCKVNGIECSSHEFADMVHVFPLFAFSNQPECGEAFNLMSEFIKSKGGDTSLVSYQEQVISSVVAIETV